jgi:mycothiol synthase
MPVSLHAGRPPESTVAQVRAIAREAADHDGVAPLGEQTLLDLAEPTAPARHLTVGEPLAGYAALDLRTHPTVELVVAPHARGRGLGRELLDAARDAAGGSGAAPLAWAHGNLPAAQALAASAGLSVRRELWQMTAHLQPQPPPRLPDDVVVRAFVVGRDEEPWLEVNARAFAEHPEQGRMTLADLRARQAEPWFDAGDLLLAEHAGHLVGFAWLKVAGDAGELYVLGVDPPAQGGGLGRWLTAVALDHLARRGVRTGVLYTEATNRAAVHLYTAAGFRRSRVDVQYG